MAPSCQARPSGRDGFVARLYARMAPAFEAKGGGGHPQRGASRATVEAIEGAGFVIERMRRFEFKPAIAVYPVAVQTRAEGRWIRRS